MLMVRVRLGLGSRLGFGSRLGLGSGLGSGLGLCLVMFCAWWTEVSQNNGLWLV